MTKATFALTLKMSKPGASEIAYHVKAPATKAGDLSFKLIIHVVEKENSFLQVVLLPLYVHSLINIKV